MNMEERFVAEYLRLSMEDGDVVSDNAKEESNSILHQRDLITRYLSDKNLYPGIQTIEFVDDGYSGTNFERPANVINGQGRKDMLYCCQRYLTIWQELFRGRRLSGTDFSFYGCSFYCSGRRI